MGCRLSKGFLAETYQKSKLTTLGLGRREKRAGVGRKMKGAGEERWRGRGK